MLEQYRGIFAGELVDFCPFPKAGEREQWNCLPRGVRDGLLSAGRERLGFAFPQITASDWLAYTRTGDRAVFEVKYFERRRALCDLALAECAEYEGRFIDGILDGIFAICEESAWQLPAHNSYVRDTPALPLPDTSKPVLDLFACETAALLATALYLLGDRLDIIKSRVLRELERRILRPYLDGWFWWMGGRGEPTNNWTVWCTQNVLLTAFLCPTSAEIKKETACKSLESIDAFLDGYGDDGCCDEGAQYYRHAGLCLFGALDILDIVSKGGLSRVWREQKIRNIARYILDAHVDGEYYINFADCSPKAGRAGAREYLFGKRCGDEALCGFAAGGWQIGGGGIKTGADGINLYYRAQEAFISSEMSEYPVPSNITRREIYYPSAGLFIARDDTYCLAVKAGDNGDSHNHNDTGSFTLYKNGRPFLIDIGVESYSKKTFSPQRYEIWTMQSSWHNLPDFDGIQQQNGEAFRAEDISFSFSETESAVSMQLKNAWPAGSGLESYIRRVCLEKGRRVTITDVCLGGYKEAAMNLILSEKPLIDGSVVMVGGLGKIIACGAVSISCEAVSVTDPRLRAAWPETIFRLRVRFDSNLSLSIY